MKIQIKHLIILIQFIFVGLLITTIGCSDKTSDSTDVIASHTISEDDHEGHDHKAESHNDDDEDGVIFTSPLIADSVANVTVTASTSGLLSGWIDFDQNKHHASMGVWKIERILYASGIMTTYELEDIYSTLSVYGRIKIETVSRALFPRSCLP